MVNFLLIQKKGNELSSKVNKMGKELDITSQVHVTESDLINKKLDENTDMVLAIKDEF